MAANSVFEKIRKLLALSKSANVHEAATAAAMAQELMMAHKIEMADLEITTGVVEEAEDVVDQTIDDHGKKTQQWRVTLAGALASAFGCKLYLWGPRIHLIGTTSNVQTVNYMQQFLSLEITRLCEDEFRKARSEGGALEEGRVWKNNFKQGAVSALSQRLYDQRRAQQARFVQTAQQALVLVRKKEELEAAKVNEQWNKIFGNGRGRTRSFSGGRASRDAFSRGQAAGRNINLSSRGSLSGAKPRLE